jgi:diaminohydroxyphosphoribosylaminopyrimidine deaminase/5-amino-6-(5-phosphoribosylamino)uracil reductase
MHGLRPAKSMNPVDVLFMRRALLLAGRARGFTSPNPMVGAVLTHRDTIVGEGWHRRAGGPHAEIEALNDAARQGQRAQRSTLYVTLEPCCTYGRTPPCVEAIIAAGIRRVVVAATDPNPAHEGQGFEILRTAGVEVVTGVLADEARQLNEVFNHWIVKRTPFITLKSAMTLDGKIATPDGVSKWITGDRARAQVRRMRHEADAVLVGINTVLADDPGLWPFSESSRLRKTKLPRKRRIILDCQARTPLTAKVITDEFAGHTLIVVGNSAPVRRVEALRQRAELLSAPTTAAGIDLAWLMAQLGSLSITSVLVEGGGEVHASFLAAGVAHRVAFFYAPKILGGEQARRAVAGDGFADLAESPRLHSIRTRRCGPDLLLEAKLQ